MDNLISICLLFDVYDALSVYPTQLQVTVHLPYHYLFYNYTSVIVHFIAPVVRRKQPLHKMILYDLYEIILLCCVVSIVQ